MLQLERLTVTYGQVVAVRALDLEVRAGEIVALLGRNGAGKSTVLRAISGLVPVAAGRIVFEGRLLNQVGSAGIVRLGVAHVPEGRLVFGDQTVEDNLRLGAYLRFLDGDRSGVSTDLEAIFQRFPLLAARRRQLAGTLSGGEQQLLAIARALMSRPRLLMLDEPSLGLAPRLIEHVFETIASVRRDGVTILLVEQLARQALSLADRAYVLETGRCLLSGPAEEVAGSPSMLRAYLGTSLLE